MDPVQSLILFLNCLSFLADLIQYNCYPRDSGIGWDYDESQGPQTYEAMKGAHQRFRRSPSEISIFVLFAVENEMGPNSTEFLMDPNV